MSYRDQDGRFRQESTGQRNKGEAEKTLRKRLVARDEGLLPNDEQREAISFNEWADWFLANLRPRFGKHKLHEITSEAIEAYLMKRLNTGKRVHTKAGLQLRGKLKPATVHQEFRILRRILKSLCENSEACPYLPVGLVWHHSILGSEDAFSNFSHRL